MSRYSGLLEQHRLQTFALPPDKCMHILTANQGVDTTTQVLYKKQGGSSGILGGGSFGAIHLELIDSECDIAPTVRAVKTISKRAAEASRVHWQHEVENLIVLSQVFMVLKMLLSHLHADQAASIQTYSSKYSAGGKMKSPSFFLWSISKLPISLGTKN